MNKLITIFTILLLYSLSLMADNGYIKKELKVEGTDSIYVVSIEIIIDSLSNKKTQKMGMCNTAGIEVVPTIYNSIERCGTSPVFIVRLDQKIGFYNIKGDELVPAEYDYINHLPANCWLLRKGDKEGVFNQNEQRITIPILYDKIAYREDGEEAFYIEDSNYFSPKGYRVLLEKNDSESGSRQLSMVDLITSKTLIPFGKYKLIEYSDKYDKVLGYKTDSDWEVSDFSGKSHLKGKMEDDTSIALLPYGIMTTKNHLVGFIPFKGKEIPATYTAMIFSPIGLAVVIQTDTISWKEKQGVIDAKGKLLVKPQYDAIYINKDHIKVVDASEEYYEYSKEGILSLDGKVIIEPKGYNSVEYFADRKVAVVSKNKEDKPTSYGLIDSKGRVLVPIIYRNVYYKENIARLLTHYTDGNKIKHGLYNVKTKKTLLPKYDEINTFVNGVATIGYFSKDGNKWGLLDENGKEIVSPIYETMFYDNAQQFAEVTRNKKHGIIGAKGKIIVPIIFDRFTEYKANEDKDGIAIGQNKDGYAVYNFRTGKEILPLKNYELVMRTYSGFVVKMDGVSTRYTVDGESVKEEE